MMQDLTVVSLYVVKNKNGSYFAGFDTVLGKPAFVTSALGAKKFSNKHDIKLRPDEMLVELKIDLSKSDVKISEPFRPVRKVKAEAVAI